MTTITNYMQNPVAHTTLTGWVQQTADTLARSTDYPELHATAVAVTMSSASDYFQVQATSLPAVAEERTWVGSAYMVGNGTVRVSVHLFGSGNLDGSQQVYTLTDTPQRVIAPPITGNAAYTGCVFRVFAGASGFATTMAISKVMFQRGSVATRYFDGDSPNAEWTGTPHASTSVLTLPDTPRTILTLGSHPLAILTPH